MKHDGKSVKTYYWRDGSIVVANCEDCGEQWFIGRIHKMARKHAEENAHQVRVRKIIIHVYNQKKSGAYS